MNSQLVWSEAKGGGLLVERNMMPEVMYAHKHTHTWLKVKFKNIITHSSMSVAKDTLRRIMKNITRLCCVC